MASLLFQVSGFTPCDDHPGRVNLFKNSCVQKIFWFQWNLSFFSIYYFLFVKWHTQSHIHPHAHPGDPPPPLFTCRTTLLQCLYKLHNGQSFYCAPYAPRRSRRRCAGPSVWVAATLFARCASTSCTARPVPLTRRPSTLTSSSCPSTRPCYSWSGVRWGILIAFTMQCNRSISDLSLCASFNLSFCLRCPNSNLWHSLRVQRTPSIMMRLGSALRSWPSTSNPSAVHEVPDMLSCAL